MTMAPRVLDHIREQFPALAHLDGTARHQSVGKSDEPWLNALLLAVGRRTGLAALINTSFNTKGHPIVNSVTWPAMRLSVQKSFEVSTFQSQDRNSSTQSFKDDRAPQNSAAAVRNLQDKQNHWALVS